MKTARQEDRVRKAGPMRFKSFLRNTILTALQQRGWKETTADDWDIYWADREWMAEVRARTPTRPQQKHPSCIFFALLSGLELGLTGKRAFGSYHRCTTTFISRVGSA